MSILKRILSGIGNSRDRQVCRDGYEYAAGELLIDPRGCTVRRLEEKVKDETRRHGHDWFLLGIEAALRDFKRIAAAVPGEEIHVDVAGDDVYVLPLQPSGMGTPRFVVHVPAVSHLEWSQTLLDGETVTLSQAEEAVAKLGEGWRLPTRQELESLLDLSRHDPAIDTSRYPDAKSCAYWTGTPCAWNSAGRWVVDFGYGGVDGPYRDSHACVRAVRDEDEGWGESDRAQGSQGAEAIGWVHSKHLKELEGGHPIRVYHPDTPVVFDSKVPVYTQPQPAVPEGWRAILEEALAMMTSQPMTLERQADAVTGVRSLLESIQRT